MDLIKIAEACRPVGGGWMEPHWTNNVRLVVPRVDAAFAWAGITSRNALIAGYATIATETPWFLPVEEFGDWGYFLREFGSAYEAQYHGRGLIQLSWSYNYHHYGQLLGLDLLAHPALALDLTVGARVMALYFREHGTHLMADRDDWEGVRRSVNGGLNGWDRFAPCINNLMAIPPDTHPVTYLAVPDRLQYHPLAKHPYRCDLAAGCQIKFTGKTTPHWAEVTVVSGTTRKLRPAHGATGWLRRTNLRTVEQ